MAKMRGVEPCARLWRRRTTVELSADVLLPERRLLLHAIGKEIQKLERALADEEAAVREEDRGYWRPLREELERLRRAAHRA